MKSSTQLLVVCGLAGVLLTIGAYEVGRPESEPEIITWARREAQTPPWSSGSDTRKEQGDGETQETGREAGLGRGSEAGNGTGALREASELDDAGFAEVESLVAGNLARLLAQRMLGRAGE